MTKDKLLAMLKKLRTVEELAIPIYTQHLESTFFLSDFGQEVQKKIRQRLLVLSKESEGHAQIFKRLIERTQESDRDVY